MSSLLSGFQLSLRSCLALALSTLLGAAADTDAFRPLFNGRDLTGWVNVNCAPETWTASNGVIYCTGVPTGALRTDRPFENFILELEWRHLRAAGNAGVFLWAGPISAPGVPFLRAIEVQVLDHGYGQSASHTTHGDVFPIHGSVMTPHGRSRGMRSFPSEERSKGAPEWNHYRIACTNGVLRLSVNGREVSGGEDCNWRRGYIALESEGSPVEFRNLRILELPGATATPEQSAPIAQGHRALYTGLDLRGWKTSPDIVARWRPSDWQLRLTATDGARGEPLWSQEAFGNIEIIADFQLPEGADLNKPLGGLHLNGSAEPVVGIGRGAGRVALGSDVLKPGAWHRLIVTVRKGKCSVTLNESPVAGPIDLPPGTAARGPLGLADLGRPITWASLYARELP